MENESLKLNDLSLRVERLWGAPAIAAFLDVSVDRVYDLAKDPNCPIFMAGKRYTAVRSELWRWTRQKPAA